MKVYKGRLGNLVPQMVGPANATRMISLMCTADDAWPWMGCGVLTNTDDGSEQIQLESQI